MTKIDQRVTTQAPSNNQDRGRIQQTDDASKRAFQQHLQKKQTDTKPADAKPQTSTSVQSEAKGAEAMMLQRGIPGRKDPLADLQAQLDGVSGKSKDGAASVDAKEGGLSLGKDGLGVEGAEIKSLKHLELQEGGGIAGMQASLGGLGSKGTEVSATTTTANVTGGKIPNEVLDKMVEQARVGVTPTGGTEFQFDMKGDVLGGMKMRINMEGGKLSAVFVSENPEIRKLIDGNLQDLQRTLEDRGIKLAGLQTRDPEEDRRQRQRQQANKDRQDSWG